VGAMGASIGLVREPGIAGTCGPPFPVGIAGNVSVIAGTVGTGSGVTGFTGSSGLTVFPPIIGRKLKSAGAGSIGLTGSAEFNGGAGGATFSGGVMTGFSGSST